MNKTAVIILHYLNSKDTRECLESLLRGDYQKDPYLIIVVINSNEDKFSESLEHDYPLVKILQPIRNAGFAGGNNLGIKYALEKGCANLILLNNDTIASETLVSGIIKKAESDTRIGLLSPKIFFAKGCEYFIDKYTTDEWGKVIWYAGGKIDWKNVYASNIGVDEVDHGQFDEEKETEFATGCCLYIKSTLIEKIGLLDENYFMYYEDVDFSIRAKKKKFKVLYYPKVQLWHKNAASSGKPGSDTHIYYQTRNRLYFGMKYAPLFTKKSLLFESWRNLIFDRIKRRAIFDYYVRRMGKGSL